MGKETDFIGKEIFFTDKIPQEPAQPVNMKEKTIPPQALKTATELDESDLKAFGDMIDDNNKPPKPPKEVKDVPSPSPAPGPAPKSKRKPIFQGSLLLGFLILLFLASSASGLFIIFSGGMGPQEIPAKDSSSLPKLASAPRPGETGAVIIKVKGVISESQSSSWREPSSASSIAKKIRSAADKDNVKAIIIDINSPGGTVGAVQDIYNAILYARNKKGKKVVALFRDVAASGGFYIAMACDKIIAQPGTMTGSIGVILQTSNFEGLMQKIGVKFDSIKSGKHKDMGSPYRTLTQEEITLFQELVDDTYQQFFEAVQNARPNINPAQLKIYADGRVFTGRKAFSIGLIDALGGEEEALLLAGELTGIKNIKVIPFRSSDSLRDWFLGMESSVKSRTFDSKIEQLSSPRVAYLWTI